MLHATVASVLTLFMHMQATGMELPVGFLFMIMHWKLGTPELPGKT